MTYASERAVFRFWYLIGSESRKWWYQQRLYVEKDSMPVREQSSDLGISKGQDPVNGGTSNFSICQQSSSDIPISIER
jgi:hypothetical protein